MGNCVLKGINMISGHGISGENMVKVVTSNGGIMELYTPITVDFITSEFPGHGLFHSRDFSSSSEPQPVPLLLNEELYAGEVYYLLPLNNHCPASASSSSSCGVVVTSSSRKSIITRQVSNVSSSSTSTPYRNKSNNTSTNKIITGSEPADIIFPRHNKSTGGVWKVRLVISPEQLSEILSEESLTEALIESLRTVAKCANGVPNNNSRHFKCTCTTPSLGLGTSTTAD